MVLVIDVGNSNIDVGAYEKGNLLFVSQILTTIHQSSVEYAVLLKNILTLRGFGEKKIEGAIVSSVVPSLSHPIMEAVRMIQKTRVLLVGPGLKTGLNIRIDNPAQLGADFVASSIGALQKYDTPAIIIDFGTATKFSVLDCHKNFVGASILPGVTVALEALSNQAAQLPHISLEEKIPLIGTNTIDSMKSGVILGNASMVDGMLSRFEKALNQIKTVVAYGQLVEAIVPHCEHDIIVDQRLLLDGLYAIYCKNTV